MIIIPKTPGDISWGFSKFPC